MDSYTVTRHKHGIVIEGPVPVGDLTCLMTEWITHGYTLCDAAISQHLHASMVVTSEAGSTAWRKELGIEVLRDTEE